jgi:hypothetical protein
LLHTRESQDSLEFCNAALKRGRKSGMDGLDHRLNYRVSQIRGGRLCTENVVGASRVAFRRGKFVSDKVEFRRRLAAAYEVDDFVAVAGLDGGVGPLRTGENFEVAFNGYAAGWEIQVAQ